MGNRIDRRFDYLRKQTEADADKVNQQQSEGLLRTAASQGRSGSGAFQKLAGQQQLGLANQKQNALEGVEAARDASQSAAEEADLNRKFQSAEAVQQRGFQSAEAEKDRLFNKGMFDVQQSFKEKLNDQSLAQFKDQFGLAMKQFKLDSKVSDFNMSMAKQMANDAGKPGFFDQLFGGSGGFNVGDFFKSSAMGAGNIYAGGSVLKGLTGGGGGGTVGKVTKSLGF